MAEEEGLQQYIESLFGLQDDLLEELRQEAVESGLPSIQVPAVIGRLLQLLILQSGPKRILEIGTLFGYSAILMARVLSSDGLLITLEVDPERADLARRNLERAGVGDRVKVREGDAHQTLSELSGEVFDLAFIDADKQSYPDYLDAVMGLTKKGSIIVADNVWFDGAPVEVKSGDEHAAGIARFNQKIASDPRLFATIIPRPNCSDAVALAIRKD